MSPLPLLCLLLSAVGSSASSQNGGFLPKKPSQGQECTSSTDCDRGLVCVPGSPSICHKRCGSFGPGGDRPTPVCGDDLTCSGKASTPCREWAGECYMYCEPAGRRLDAQQPQNEGGLCGTDASDPDGTFHGDCGLGLKCVPPAAGAAPGAPSACHKVCGVFGESREKVFATCSEGQTCSGKAATPCSARAGECYMYCDGAAGRRLGEQPRSGGQ